ncbi:LPD38 domain-containing protein [Stutzerimonas stutzeri]|uniref:LPD38 domain-containing protein n=1 Tax=Stutzerimonas stutzeri TaxID=316 RepID=UPI00244CCF51|nr:LPD38 domain-containing protein [Stutzerimonas stutzeri]MDH0156471.1 LPD5 domain-containing protein [Stutzerimonas stutzeri]
MAGPWEKYQQQPAIEQTAPGQAGPWAKYRAAEPANDAPAEAAGEQGGIQAADFGKELAGGALIGTGSVVSGFGDLLTTAGGAIERGARAVLPGGTVDALKSIPAPSDLLFRPAGRQIEAAGKQVQATKTDAAKQALEASTPQGDVLDPSSWSMGDDPSLVGYGLHGANLVGQFVPQAAALAIPGGQARMTGMAGIGGLQAGGSAGNEVEQRLAAIPDAELQQVSDLYRELRAGGVEEADARAHVSATARAAAFQGAAPAGALGGAMTNYALGPLQRQIGGGVGRRLAGGLLLDAPAEGAQEVSEAVAARAATNRAIGERRDLTEDTFGDAVLGAMGGAGHATLGAALGRPQPQARPADPAAEDDATFDDTPQTAALPAPGLQGLPSPEPTFYADSQGNVQDVGPVRNVDGQMQPDPQGRQWVNPRNRADRPVGGEGMERQVPRGEPAPLEGQFQHGSRQRVAEAAAQKGRTLEGETQQAALPPPEAIVVDGQGNAQRGATAPQVFERAPSGGRGMDQQAPTAGRRNDDFEYITRASGEPFQAHGAAKASKVFREAKKAGRNPTVAKVDGGFAVRVPADPKRYQMRPIDQAAHQAATSPSNDLPAPTPAQIEAGNYKKGRIRVQGLDISIENPRGSERSGTGPDGTPRRRTMSDHYGYIKRTTGADGEQVDVYVGPQEDSDQVFVVDQINQQDGSFDEHKAMLGYPDQATALQAYSANFDKGWKVGPVTAMPVAEFKSWLKGGALSKPLALPSPIVQPAAAAAPQKPQEKSKPKGARRAVDRDRDSVVQAAIRLGGITNRWKQDTTGDTKGNKSIPGIGALWSDVTGTSLDDMASLLDQHGYVPAGEMDRDGGVSWLQDALRDELAGRKTHYAPDSARQLEQYELEMLDRINEQLAAERDLREAEYARIEAEHGPEAAADARSFDEMAIARSEQLDGALEDAQTDPDTYVDGEPVDEAAAARRDDEIRQADEREDRAAGEDPGTAFDLEQQTEAGLKEQAERNAAAEKARADQEREAEQKVQADRDREDFTLTGSNRISDVAAARGQNDMFGAQPTTPASKAKEQATELVKGKPSPAKPAAEPKPVKVEDFGEKLGGARKDELRGVRERLDNMDDQGIANSKLSELWPKGEIDRIEDSFHAAAYQTVRDFIPAKPRVSYRVAGWVNRVKAARELLAELSRLGSESTVAKMREFSPSLRSVADKIELLMGIERSQWGRIGRVSMAVGSFSQDGQMVPGSWAEVEIDGRSKHFYGKKSIAEAIGDIRLALNLNAAPEKKMKFDVYSDRGTGEVFIAKNGDRETRRLATFKTVAEARDHIANSHESLVAAWDAVKNRDNVTKADMRRSLNEVRAGTDHRGGADITPEQFLEAFGFRGVEFGNWVAQGAARDGRQGMLNDAYDSFMDLAEVIGVPPKALSLEGRLGIGFGSRGRGRASAHFEPGTVVINLTKTKGAGSLAHEWFHALDNYFAGKRGESDAGKVREASYITYRPEPMLVNKKYPAQRMTRAKLDMYQANHPNAPLYAEENWTADPAHPEGVRPKVEKAFAELVETLDRSPMAKRSAVLDRGTADGYWSRIIERGARSFETYVIARLADRGYRNDYLANVRTLEEFSRSQDRYPYLTPDEQGPVNEAFDKLFATIETRETDSGVSLYRLDDGENGQLQADAVTQALAASPELAGVKVVQSFDDLPLSARIRAKRDGVAPDELRGIFSSGATYVVAGNHASVTDALYTAVHEEVGHRGIHGLLGDKLDATMERLYASQAASAKGRQRIAQIREAYAKVLRKLDARKRRLMIAEEMVALLIEDGERPTALQRVLSKIRELLRALIPQVPWTYTDILALGEQSRRWLRDNQAGAADGERMLYALGGKRQHTSEAFTDLTAKQKEALNKIAPRTAKQQAIDWFRDHSDRALLKIRQGLVDRYAALRELDEAAHGKDVLSTDIASSAWVLARMSSAASGALHAMLNNGRIYLDQQQKVIDIQDGEALGLGATLARLGSAAEIERFMGWIAGNRSAKLAAEGRENLFDAAEIDALRTLNRGTTEHGKARGALYSEVFTEFQQYRDDVLAIAEQTGVITPESRALWRDEFYVPFYRVMDEDGAVGPMASKGLTRQEAYKKLKGGSQSLNDLLQNTLLNFNHLLQASLKNQAAAQAIDNAEQLGIAQPVSEAARDKKASTFVLKAGEKQWYNIADPLVFEALNSLSDAGLNNTAVRAMSFFKRLFTNMTTITPQFIVANLLRDSMSATATSPVSKNFLKNIAVGGSSWTDARKRARMLASGGAFSFGHIYSNDPDEVKAHITRNLRSAKLIDGPKLVPQALKAGWDAWNAVANTAENANRAAIFEQNEQGSGKLAAAFEARDLMDFSMHGAWPAVRFLIRVVPFLNARLQGLDKLYRAGVKPSLLTAFGQGSASDKQAAARFTAVVGALSLASMALLLVNNDDEEFRKLEEWQKDTYWFVRLGGKAFFIPKPFEVGAIATMAERLLQQGIDDKATGKLFAQRLGHTLTQTFSFSPVPHMFQPVLDVYSNVDAFTGRPIESAGMDRLSKGLRTRATTTAPARAASAVSRVFGDEFPLAVSPIQADHLIAGYLGQVGAWGAGMVDTMWRAANGESQPAKHWHEYQPIRRFYRDLETPAAYTRYSTLFYEGLREASKAYADVKELQELGRMDEAREVISEKRDLLGARKQLNQVQRRLTAINGRMDAVRLGELDADAKRRELDRLLVIKNRLTEMAGKRLEDMRAKR